MTHPNIAESTKRISWDSDATIQVVSMVSCPTKSHMVDPLVAEEIRLLMFYKVYQQ
jgi:hypothetical protein